MENWVGRNHWTGKLLSHCTPDCPACGDRWGLCMPELGLALEGEESKARQWIWRGAVKGVLSALCALNSAHVSHARVWNDGLFTVGLAELAWPFCQCQPVVAMLVSAGRGSEHLPHIWEGRTKPARRCCDFWGSETKQTTPKQFVW